MGDHGDRVQPGALFWLQAWYTSQCDGEWEHTYGVEITTLDNPGWLLTVNLTGTDLESQVKPRSEIYRSEHDWCTSWTDDEKFHAACGPLNLGEAIHDFRRWAQSLGPGTPTC
jgi:Immunity protein 53